MMARCTPYCMVNDDSTSRMVATSTGVTSRTSPAGGHGVVSARRLKNAANRPEKNISSDASHTITPTCSRWGR